MIKLNPIESAVVLSSKGWTPKNYEPYNLIGKDTDNVNPKHTFLYCQYTKLDSDRAVFESLVKFMLKCGEKFGLDLYKELINQSLDGPTLNMMYGTTNPDKVKLYYDIIDSYFQNLNVKNATETIIDFDESLMGDRC